MRRTELKRGKGLGRKKPLQARPPGRSGASGRPASRPAPRVLESGESLWKQRRTGRCAACGKRGPIVLHHIVDKGRLKRLGLPLYEDLRNALPLGAPLPWGGKCTCHDDHTTPGIGEKKIPLSKVPRAAREFAVEALGPGPAENYFQRYYGEAS